jgi:hypothetical protein
MFSAQKFKMADESNLAAKTFFSDKNFKNDSSSKKTFLLYFLAKMAIFFTKYFQIIKKMFSSPSYFQPPFCILMFFIINYLLLKSKITGFLAGFCDFERFFVKIDFF